MVTRGTVLQAVGTDEQSYWVGKAWSLFGEWQEIQFGEVGAWGLHGVVLTDKPGERA